MAFDNHAFISYAHLDNLELTEGHKGWVANLHHALEVKLAGLLGKPPQIWRDPKLQGNDYFADTLLDRLRRVAVLVSVVSPSYINSEWTRKELVGFWKAAEETGGVRFHDKARIFKVEKTRVDREMLPSELQPLLGYEFFKIDPETEKVREFDKIFGREAETAFWLKLDDLVQDMCALLKALEDPAGETEKAAVFLARTTRDLKEEHDAIKRDLQQHGYTVLPVRALPLVASEVRAAVREDLARCQLSIHLAGKCYSSVPEGGEESLLEIENELAIERREKGGFSRLLWIPAGLQVEDERQRKVVERFRHDPRIQDGADLLETSLEDLRTVIQDWLKRARKAKSGRAAPSTLGENPARLYLIYDQRDTKLASPWADFLFDQGLEVIHPVFEGDETEIREYHEENLRACDGVLILYGVASELWLWRKLRELKKSRGYGRTKPGPAVAISIAPPETMDKARFRTHEAILIRQLEGFSPDPLRPFVARLKGGEQAQPG